MLPARLSIYAASIRSLVAITAKFLSRVRQSTTLLDSKKAAEMALEGRYSYYRHSRSTVSLVTVYLACLSL